MVRIAGSALIVAWLLTGICSPVWSIEVGDTLPDFTVQTFEGNRFSKASVEGKAMLLVFWNTWCPDCMRELPKINRLAGQLGPKGLAVFAVNTAMNDSETKARAYWNKSEYMFPSAFDRYFELGHVFGVRGVPTVFLVDSKGVVRYKNPRLPEDMEERFRGLSGKE